MKECKCDPQNLQPLGQCICGAIKKLSEEANKGDMSAISKIDRIVELQRIIDLATFELNSITAKLNKS